MAEIKKPNTSSEAFSSDLKTVQKISGAAGASAVIITVLIIASVPLNASAVSNVAIVGLVTAIFTAFFYLNPRLYLNEKYILLPDFAYILATVIVMKNLGVWAYLYIIFFIIIISVDAFTYNKKNFAVVFFSIILGVIYASFPIHEDIKIFIYRLVFELYGITTISIVLRLYAKKALSYKDKKNELELLNKHLEVEKKEIKNLFDNISDAIISVDAKNNIVLTNEAATNILGIEKDNSTPNKTGKLAGLCGNDGPIDIPELILADRKPYFRDDLKLVEAKGTRTLYTSVSPFYDGAGRYEGSIIFMHDITKEQELEKKKAEFTAIASHELRTPLSVIEGYLHFLLSNEKLKYDSETRKYLLTAHESTLDLINLSKSILLAAKAEEGTLELNLEKTNLKKIVKNLVNEHAEKAKLKGLKLLIDVEDLIPEINTDPLKLKEILNNLLDNAIKFTTSGNVSVEVKEDGNQFFISVKDSGVGISKEDEKFIFQKFYRAEKWQTRTSGGTGLGLYISKMIAERLGGDIKFKTNKGKGSTFTLTLPIIYYKDRKSDQKKTGEKELTEFMKTF